MAPVGRYSKTGGSCWGWGLPKKYLPKTLKWPKMTYKLLSICCFVLLERNFLWMCGSWKVIVVPGSGIVGSAELRKCEHENKRGGNWGEEGWWSLSFPSFFLFFLPRQLFACLSLSRLPHYLRAWNRLKGKRSQRLQLSLKVSLKLNWNFQRDGGEGWGFKRKETCGRGTDWYYWSSTILQDLLLDTLIWLLSWLLFFVALFLGLSLEGLSALERHTCNSVI